MSEILPIGENPKELAMRELARELVSEWLPWGVEREKSQGWWNLGTLGSIYPRKDENDPPFWFWIGSQNKQGMGTKMPVHSINELRAAAIGLLVFCEVEDLRREMEEGNASD